MKLSKQQEKELLKAYNAYWEGYLQGDIKSMAPLLAKEYTQVGSAESEVFFNKKDALKFLRETIDQVAGKLDMRNRVITPEQQGDFILIHEQCDLYARDGKKWIFYAKFRASSLMQKKKDGWKFKHQHSSFPDTKTDEGQNIAIDKIAEENSQLREAVKRRTTELEQKNRELEIETALEKVRVVAMSMKQAADMLDICKTIALQLQSLGVNEIRNVQTAIFYEGKGVYMNYEYYAKHDKTFITETSYTNHKIHIDFAAQMLKGKGEFFTTQIKGKKKLNDWVAYQKTTNVFIDPFIETAKSLNYYWYSLGPVALGTSTYQPLTENETALFKRFLKVFELSYRRYLDIEKAEAQAKEARIEAALEKVRARTMGMQRSDELAETAVLLFHQLLSLNLELRGCGINIWEKDEKICTAWMSTPEGGLMQPFNIPLTENPVFIRFYESRQNGEDFWVQESGEKELAARFQYLSSLPVIGELLAKDSNDDKEAPTFVVDHVVNFSHGNLIFITYKHCPDEWDTFKRFAKVFEQTYTRFLDLQKAEAQSREAQIELALERVRARTMAMQHSVELQDAANLLFQQVKALGLPILTCGYNIWEKDEKICTAWMSSEDGLMLPSFKIPLTESPFTIRFYESRQKGESFYAEEIEGDALAANYRYLMTLPGFAERIEGFSKAGFTLPTFQINHVANFSHGNLIFVSYQPVPDAWDIFKRFAKVFEQTYTRFLDLQKAESQARESQIQLALERVRARTMAMQKSGELPDAANLLFQQMQALGMPAWSAGYCIWDDDKQGITLWMSSEGVMQPSFHMPLTVDPSLIHWKETYERNESFHIEAVGGEELVSHYRYMRTLPGIGEVLDSIINAGHPLPSFQIFHCVYFSQGFLLFITYEPVPEAHDIFKRFGNVFDQTYTRFLDLQKAEAQSREAQIELGLERVRARAMAMQKSDELAELVHTVFKELTKLHFSLHRCLIMIYDPETNGSTWWMSHSEEASLPIGSFVKYHEYPPYLAYLTAWKDRTLKWKYLLEGNEKKEWDNFVFSETELSLLPQFIIDGMKGFGHVFLNGSFNNFGSLTLATLEPMSDEHFEILLRFAKVFDLTYTRFNDLQKAEAQTKEARIEAALERVRSRTMAMHKSDELLEVVTVLADQLVQLNFKFDNVSFGENNQEGDFKFWFIAAGQPQPLQIQVPYCDNPAPNRVKAAQKKGLKFFADVLSKEENRQWTQHLIDHSAVKLFPDKVKNYILNCDGYARSTSLLKNISLYIGNYKAVPYTEEENNSFQRFAQVFEQSYTRFLDLKKAEAQAREAQIEAALEKIRSRSLAMHRSDELKEVMSVMFQRLTELDVLLGTVAVQVDDPVTKDSSFWIGNDLQDAAMVILPYDEKIISDENYMSDYWKARNTGESFFNRVYSFEQKNRFFRYVFANNDERTIPPPIREYILAAPSHVNTLIIEKNSALFADNYDNQFYSEDKIDVLKRTARVFDQAYVRFLDLQKAEAQAREAKIEAALEKVRSRSLAMHNSSELREVVALVFDRLKELGFLMDEAAAVIITYIDGSKDHIQWIADPSQSYEKFFRIPYTDHSIPFDLSNAKENGFDFFSKIYPFEEKNTYFHYLFNHSDYKYVPDAVKEMLLETKDYGISVAFEKKSAILIPTNHGKLVAGIDKDILKRFVKVFEQAYTRFLDLQKAEAQAKEARIEAALEKIRSRSLAMHHSDELQDVVNAVFERLKALEIEMNVTSIFIFKDGSKDWEQWVATADTDYSSYFHLPYTDNPIFNDLEDARKNGKDFYAVTYSYEQKNDWFNYAFLNTEYRRIPDTRKSFLIQSEFYKVAFALAKHTGLQLCRYSGDDFSESDQGIMKRFAKVFEQAYVRFLDLQKAEAQSREAQIELSLERVRAKTMAMHNSADVGDTAAVMVDELKKLGIETIRCGIGIMHEPGDMEVWTIRTDDNKTEIIIGWLDMNMHPLLHGAFQSWRIKNESYSYELRDDDLLNYYNAINNYPGYPIRYNTAELPNQVFHNEFHFAEGTLFSFSLQQLADDQRKIFKRFAGVFGQTYRRYLDLKKAESQARQAKIEAAMEKVRSRAMAMQKPDELVEVAELLRTEMGLLGVEELETSSIYIHNETSGETECWYAIQKDKKLVSDHMTLDLQDTWVGRQMFDFYRSDEKKSSIIMQGENRKEWINYCAAHSDVLVGFYGEDIPDRVYHLYKFSNGYMGAASPGNISVESWDLLQRATSVFSLAYTRFSDLQLAEAQAKEAQVETALERVRSRTLAMQKSDELAETAAVLFKQLIGLGIAPNRLYIGIIDSDEGEIEFWITDEDGSKVSTMFSGNANKNVSMKKMYDGWKEQRKSIMIDMQGKELEDYFHYLGEELHVPFKGGLEQKRRLQYIAYFSKGFIGMASPEEQPAETVSLMERFAYVFNLTFTRFNDLKIAEAHALQAEEDLIKLQTEKKRAEEALTELRATQTQLIQAEKMASLGQLTAGIAHEIQNPLNFVNNFSEVSNELIQEMVDEADKGNIAEVKLIAGDLKQNLEKIHHHGKRADSIVKGMLEHSRTSTGSMEPTDINALADEYLRLSYHGFRAKDKLFNTAIHTDFDNTIDKINIIGQDIGRVLLNLYNNAFYAVNEKKTLRQAQGPVPSESGYEPSVTVTTKNSGDTILISVKDNGNGIPQTIVDKIFQPFFTTKPTGQGTGLGLSLSYDIVKAHGGELTVRSIQGEGQTGSEFTIHLHT